MITEWRKGRTLVRPTDSNTPFISLPEPHEDEMQFILGAIYDYLNVKVRRTNIFTAWNGIYRKAVGIWSKERGIERGVRESGTPSVKEAVKSLTTQVPSSVLVNIPLPGMLEVLGCLGVDGSK
ncbi:hypothetical protein K1719_047456 [Acacia pycnantha]|nr:hypothetical protein K1719_047456 [Acacia pycnantha]